jgi:hypothetical protein
MITSLIEILIDNIIKRIEYDNIINRNINR